MEKEKTPPRLAADQTHQLDWYTSEGWCILNKLLTELAANQLDVVWVENFESVRKALAHISKKELIRCFNNDALDWKMKADADGTLFVCRNN